MEDSGTGLSLTYRLKNVPGYEFYRCDMRVNDRSHGTSEV